jgi:hypothetical protein
MVDPVGTIVVFNEARNLILSRGDLLPDWAAEPMAAV